MSDTQNPPQEESPDDQQEPLSGAYDPEAVEPRWQEQWVQNGTYAYENGDADTQYTIDTPPPTVSGDLHMGHLYQFTLDAVAEELVPLYERLTSA